jgi:dihydrofolate reductase
MKTFILATLTADGLIGRHANHLVDWSSKEDKQLFVRLTKEAGVMIMGANQFATLGRALPGRRTIVYTHHPEKITVEGIETTSLEPAELIAKLESEGATGVAICGGAQIYSLFMSSGVVDELYLNISPLLFGAGITLFSRPLEAKLQLLDSSRLGGSDVLLHYRVDQ